MRLSYTLFTAYLLLMMCVCACVCFSQLIEAIAAAFKKCTLAKRTDHTPAPATTTTTVTTTTTTAASTTTTTTTTVSSDTAAASTDVATKSDSGNGVSGTSTQHNADAPDIKVKLDKAKVCLELRSVLLQCHLCLMHAYSATQHWVSHAMQHLS